MIGAYLRLVRGSPLALSYAAILVVGAVILALLPGDERARVIEYCSTNLANLRLRPWFCLGASAFVAASIPALWQVLGLLWVFATAQRWVGALATMFVAAVGHVGATLLVSVTLASGIARNRLSDNLRHAPDVGYSYGLACTAMFVASRVPRRWRGWYVLALVVVFGAPLVYHPTFTDLGHATALLLGAGLALLANRVAAQVRADGRDVS